ncbi:MAG: MBOAT family protein [Planctomycetes bacterium]|nr:MBOAT family protein [Planctomycetota bacterium]
MSIVSWQWLGMMLVVTAGTWLVPRSTQVSIIVLGTAVFILWQAPVSFVILAVTTLCFYFLLHSKIRGSVVVAMIVAISALFLWFKWGRSLDVYNPDYSIVPLGISYYSLRLIHYAIESWKNKIPEHSFSQFVSYLWFLPTLTAGPINGFHEFSRSLRRRRWDPQLFSRGLERILYGYVKIIILGNYLVSLKLAHLQTSIAMDYIALAAYLDCLIYGLNLYFQFSGYSDIAIGFALLLGFEIMENFSYPFLARNINDFWNRWHISLSRWCREYIYMPVMSMSRSPRLGILAAMIILGLWHEMSWRYLAWGGYHGLGIAIWQRWSNWRQNTTTMPWLENSRIASIVSWAVTMNFVLFSFILTKENNLTDVYNVFTAILGFGG